MPERMFSRRETLKAAAAASLAAIAPGAALRAATHAANSGKLPERPFGATGQSVCMLAMGTGTIAEQGVEDEVVDIIRHGLDAGITYVDTAPSYQSEQHVGRAIEGRRNGLFLATKTLYRDHDGAMRELEQSLRLLKTDHIELWQVHSLGHERATPQQELAALRDKNGVMKAMRRMKEQGVVRWIGFTGHTSPRHMQVVLDDRELAFDAMLFILSAGLAKEKQLGWENDVLPAGRKRRMGLIAMKVFGGGAALRANDNPDKAPSPADLLEYVWRRDIPVANVGLYSKTEINAAVAALRAYAAADARPQRQGSAPTERFEPTPQEDALRRRLSSLRLPFEDPGYADVFPRR